MHDAGRSAGSKIPGIDGSGFAGLVGDRDDVAFYGNDGAIAPLQFAALDGEAFADVFPGILRFEETPEQALWSCGFGSFKGFGSGGARLSQEGCWGDRGRRDRGRLLRANRAGRNRSRCRRSRCR